MNVVRGQEESGAVVAMGARAARRSSLRLKVPPTAPSLVWSAELGAELQRMVTGLRYSLWILLDHAERGCPAPREFAIEQVQVAHHLEAMLAALQAGSARRRDSFDLWPLLRVRAAAESTARVEPGQPALTVTGSPEEAVRLLDAVLSQLSRWQAPVRVSSADGAMSFECSPGEAVGDGGFARAVSRQCERQAESLGLSFALTACDEQVRVTLRPRAGACGGAGGAPRRERG